MRNGTHSIMRSLLAYLVVCLGPSLGCVGLTPPWNVNDGADAHGDATGGAREAGGSTPEDAAVAWPSDARALDTELTTDGRPVEESDASDSLLADTSVDKSTDTSDSSDDPLPPSPDVRDDATATDSKEAGNEDRAADRTVPEPDVVWADTLNDTSTSPSDGNREAPAPSGLLVSYPCESASGAVLSDVSGHRKHASLANGSGSGSPVGFGFAAGKVGNALTLSAADKAYVKLPNNIVAHLSELTVATWVRLDSTVSFQRIFDFGVDTNTFMYLTNSSGGNGGVRFRITSASGKNQVVEAAVALSKGTWTHVAVTLGNDGVALYLDGALVAEQAPAILRPSDLGETTNNFIGRSPFTSDPYLGGQIDEFRIYDRVLGVSEIGELANGQ